MKKLFFLLIFSFSLCNAQHVSIKKDTILSTKDTVSLYIQNNMLSPMYLKCIANDTTPKGIIYFESLVLKPSERFLNFMKIPRANSETDS